MSSLSRRSGLLVTIALCCAVVMSACTAGPSRRPPLVTAGGQSDPSVTAQHTTAPTTSRPIGPGGPGQQAEPVDWGLCPARLPTAADDGTTLELRCAQVTAPISYGQPGRGSLQLAITEARTPDTADDAPPLVVLFGDPGTYGRADIARVVSLLPPTIRARYAIVVMDPRGTGASAEVACVGDDVATAILGMAADPTLPAGATQLHSIARQLTFDCGDLVGAALTKLNSTNAADDLDTVRAALGVDRLTVVASRGGATIGAVYAHRYPGHLAAMVLDSPRNPLADRADMAAASALAAADLLNDFSSACGSFADGCPLGADPRAAITTLVSGLATSGVRAGPWVITGGSVLMTLLHVLPDRGAWPELAGALAALENNEAQPLAGMLTTAMGSDELNSRLAGRILYSCNDTAERLAADDIERAAAESRKAAPLFGPFTVGLAGLCGSWPAPDEPVSDLLTRGTPPILVIGSAHSPRYPYDAARAVSTYLASATLITWQSARTGALTASSCVTKAVEGYLLREVMPPRGLLCPP